MTLVDTQRVIPAVLWGALMLIYLLGDVLRVYAGDHVPGQLDGTEAAGWMWVAAALLMLIPITMMVVSLVVTDQWLKWLTVGATGFLVVLNLAGLPYPSAFDNMLIVIGLGVNGLTAWQVWGMTA